MITITEATRYIVQGRVFKSEAEAIAFVENALREAFDRLVLGAAVLSPGERIRLSDAFVEHRDALAALCWEVELPQ